MQTITPSSSATDRYLQTRGGLRVRYRVQGDGPPLVMIHGVGAPLEFWRPLQEHLDHFRTILVDIPGSGHSSVPRGRFRLRDFAAVVDELLEHLDIDSAAVLGLSLGGMVAQEVAHRHPRRVDRLILVSTTCGMGGLPVPPRAWGAIANPMRFYSQGHIRKIAPLMYGEQVTADPALLEEHMHIREQVPASLRGHIAQVRAAAPWSSLPWLRRLRLPVLVITGSGDRLVPVLNGRLLARAIPGARLEIIEGGSHVCVLQDPARAAQLIEDFLDEG